MNMTKREKILIIFVFILAVVCIYYFYFLQPCLKEIADLNTQKASKELKIQTNEQMQLKVDEISQKITEEEEQIAQFKSDATAAFDQPAVLVYLYETISKYGQKVIINFEESRDLGHLKACNISVTMNGTYEALKSTLKELAEGEYFIRVTGLTASHYLTVTTDPASTEETSDETAETATKPEDTEDEQDMLNITLSLEFYDFGGEIPPDKTYPFTRGAVQYGGDIFY